MIRPLERDDLPAVAALYAELNRRDPRAPAPGYARFFARVLLDDPELTDPEFPSLVYEDGAAGVVGVIGCHPRRFRLDERRLRLACAGPLIVSPAQRSSGVGALLLRRFAGGPQEMTFNDRSTDQVHTMWRLLGAATDGLGVDRMEPRARPGGVRAEDADLAGHQAAGPGRCRRGAPQSGHPPGRSGAAARWNGGGTWSGGADRVGRAVGTRVPSAPRHTPAYLDSLFALIGETDLGRVVVRRLVRGEDGRPRGAYVMIVAPHGTAHVLNVVTAGRDAGLVLEHLLHDAAAAGAVEVRGRTDATLLGDLFRLGCRLGRGSWSTVRSGDQELVNLALGGRALIPRMEGEWWMRPRPEAL